MDGELLYKTTRAVVKRGLIGGFRALITAGKQQIDDDTPIRIAGVQTKTEEFMQRLWKKPSDHDGGTGGSHVPEAGAGCVSGEGDVSNS